MSEEMPERMSEEMPEKMSERMPEDMPERMSGDMHRIALPRAEINVDNNADPDLKLTYEDLRLRVVNDPVGQCVVMELLLRLFVLHILGASPNYVAQAEGVTVEHLTV